MTNSGKGVCEDEIKHSSKSDGNVKEVNKWRELQKTIIIGFECCGSTHVTL